MTVYTKESWGIFLNPVPEVDRQGELCEKCEREFAPIEAQVYLLDEDGERKMEDCCLDCLVDTVRAAATGGYRNITVEIGEAGYEQSVR